MAPNICGSSEWKLRKLPFWHVEYLGGS